MKIKKYYTKITYEDANGIEKRYYETWTHFEDACNDVIAADRWLKMQGCTIIYNTVGGYEAEVPDDYFDPDPDEIIEEEEEDYD